MMTRLGTRHWTWLMALIAIHVVFAWGHPLAAAKAEWVPIGVAKIEITPETPVRMYGYAARTTESEGIAGRLYAAAMAIGGDDGEGPAVLLTVDCGAVPRELTESVLQRIQSTHRLKPERFQLSHSHNHSGPNLRWQSGIEGQQRQRLVQYAERLTDRLEQVVRNALDSRQPARLAWTQGSVDFAANRRVLKDGKWAGFGAVAEGAVDHSLPLLCVTDAEGNRLAVVVNYACHATTLRGNFRQIHGDWVTCAQEAIQTDFPGTIAMVTIGCGADADPHPHGTVLLCEQHGRAVADEVKRLLDGPLRPVSGAITARETTLEIPFQPLPSDEELQHLAKTSSAVKRLISQQQRGEQPPDSRSFHIAAWTFGDDLAMVFFSDEVVVDYALRLKREFDADRLWVTAYAGDVAGYIVSKRLLSEGGYEVNNSLSHTVTYGQPQRLRPAMEDRVMQALHTLLPETFRADGTSTR
jgi:neutral ceramidase